MHRYAQKKRKRKNLLQTFPGHLKARKTESDTASYGFFRALPLFQEYLYRRRWRGKAFDEPIGTVNFEVSVVDPVAFVERSADRQTAVLTSVARPEPSIGRLEKVFHWHSGREAVAAFT